MRNQDIKNTRSHHIAGAVAGMLLRDLKVNWWSGIDGFPQILIDNQGEKVKVTLSFDKIDLVRPEVSEVRKVETSFFLDAKQAVKQGKYFENHGTYDERDRDTMKLVQEAISKIES
jgi:hypothetical protein